MEPLVQNLIKATGWSILHSLWQGALIYGIVMLIQMTAVHMKSKTKYILAFSANSLLLICFAGTFLLAFEWPMAELNQARVTSVPLTAELMNPASMFSHYAELFFPYLVCFYAVGLIIQSVLVWSGYRKISLLKKGPHLRIPENWNILFESLTKQLGIKKKVTFWLSAQVQVPLIIGYLKPVVLFPVALATQMDLQQVEAILIHELSHIRRNDYLFNLIRTMIDTVLFFNPFIWLIGKFIDIEREHACDDLVVQLTQTPMTYAHALLKLELLTDKAQPALTLAATGNKQYLYQRIKRITDMKTNYMNSKQKFFAITLTVATIISIAWIKPSKAEAALEKLNKTDKHAAAVLLNAQINRLAEQNPVIQTNPADTSKKKPKKTPAIIVKSSQDSTVNTIYKINANSNTDSTISIVINNSLKPLKGMLVKIDSLSNQININTNNQVNTDHKRMDLTLSPLVIKDLNGVLQNGKTIKINGMKIKNMQKLSAENQEKLKTFQKEMAEITKRMQVELSTIDKTKMEQLTKNLKGNFYSPEQLAQLSKMSEQLAKATLQFHNFEGFGESDNGTIVIKSRESSSNGNGTISIQSQEVSQSKEYKQLKSKFDADVKALMEKKAQKNKK